MSGLTIFVFIFAMWILIIIGGGISVLILAPVEISGYGEFDLIISSLLKGIVSIGLVISWIFILSKVKNWIFRSQLKVS
ncbi:MAG TPA: hypothetical protein VD731_04215 [Nitrosopumilaceae archaeon]|nr:hypothetical protein [Nitrosopumilaceae archaeon]